MTKIRTGASSAGWPVASSGSQRSKNSSCSVEVALHAPGALRAEVDLVAERRVAAHPDVAPRADHEPLRRAVLRRHRGEVLGVGGAGTGRTSRSRTWPGCRRAGPSTACSRARSGSSTRRRCRACSSRAASPRAAARAGARSARAVHGVARKSCRRSRRSFQTSCCFSGSSAISWASWAWMKSAQNMCCCIAPPSRHWFWKLFVGTTSGQIAVRCGGALERGAHLRDRGVGAADGADAAVRPRLRADPLADVVAVAPVCGVAAW